MRSVLRFKRFLRVEVVAGDGVYLMSEQRSPIRLQGALAERLARVLDGRRDRHAVLSELAGDFSPDRVETALDRLLAAGHVVEVDADQDERAGGFWEMHGLAGDTVLTALGGKAVSIVELTSVAGEWLAPALAASGIATNSSEPDLTVVLAEDYLDPRLATINETALRDGAPWLLAKPVGGTIWVGPVFEPGRTACWQCLASRLSANELVQAYLRTRDGATAPVTWVADLSLTRQLGAQLTALHATRRLADPAGATATIFTFDTVGMAGRQHVVVRRPQCAVCGDPALQAAAQTTPITLTSRPKAATTDGGHRAATQEALLAEQEPLISPITGVVTQLRRVSTGVEGLHAYQAGQNFAVPLTKVGELRAGLRSSAAGKGMSDAQARSSAIGEAIERSSGVYRGDEARITDSYAQLGSDAIEPNAVQCFSERQFAQRELWNARESPYQRVCDPFDPDAVIDWTPVWSLSRQRFRYLPTSLLFYGCPSRPGHNYAIADSNGNAAGTSREDAILQGFLELVERDCVATWWYPRSRVPGIDLDSFADPYFASWQRRYASIGRETWALDISTDLGIPAVATVSRRVGGADEDILLGFGAHFDVRVAIGRAMTEMNQFLPAAHGTFAYHDTELQRWWRTATVANQPYLRPAARPARSEADFTDLSSADLAEDVRTAQRLTESAGLELLVLDQTRPDVGVPVVKVIVPGLRHFWARFAPGRLYDVPVRVGWRDTPCTEADLNPIAMFL